MDLALEMGYISYGYDANCFNAFQYSFNYFALIADYIVDSVVAWMG